MSVLRMNIENYFKNATLLLYIQKKQFMWHIVYYLTQQVWTIYIFRWKPRRRCKTTWDSSSGKLNACYSKTNKTVKKEDDILCVLNINKMQVVSQVNLS